MAEDTYLWSPLMIESKDNWENRPPYFGDNMKTLRTKDQIREGLNEFIKNILDDDKIETSKKLNQVRVAIFNYNILLKDTSEKK